jgi:RNA polymerase sigma-70 factor (ECF subfamily)
MQVTASLTRGDEQFAPRAEQTAGPPLPLRDPYEGWLAAIAHGDQRAFEAFYDATLPRVFALARRICIDLGLTEEVVEDVYVQAWRDAGRYDAKRGVPLAWLQTITRSRALDALRRRDEAQSVAAPETLRDELDESADPLDLLLLFESTSATRKALSGLPARERQLIALAFLRGLTHAEIAAETGWPLGTIKTSIRRALVAMRQVLLEHAPDGARVALPGGVDDELAN